MTTTFSTGPAVVPGRIPSESDLERWRAADREARPARLARLRERMETEGVGAYFGVRRENSRYLTGIELGDGEEKVAGNSGQFFVGRDEVVVLADSRYTLQVREQCPDARMEQVYNDIFSRWPELLASLGSPSRVAVEAGFVSYGMWKRLAEASPAVELVAAEGWVEELRQTKEPAELERVAASCAVADAALRAAATQHHPGRDRTRAGARSSNGRCAPTAPRRWPSTSPACSARKPRCRMARPANARSRPERSCCSTSARRCAATAPT